MAKVVNIRGLQNFISEIRSAPNREAEKIRVDKELGKIRKKFAATKDLSEYDKKKYVWKLLYIYMLGYPVEFGHKQATDLIAAQRYAEKQVGYMACSILLNEKDDFLRLIINSVRTDIICRNEAFQCLALNFIGSVGGMEMANLLMVDVQELLVSGAVRPIVRKKAALALLRLLRKSASDVEDLLQPDVWAVKLNRLFEEQNVGVLLGTMSLLLGIVSRSYQGYEPCVPKVVAILEKLRSREVGPDYAYYGIASPWLQVKCLRVLQYFPPPDDPAVMHSLTDMLTSIISGGEGSSKNVNKGNAQHAIVLEAIALALAVDAGTELLAAGVALLGKFIGLRDPNLKYLGLENMVRLAGVPAVMETVNRHQKVIIGALKEADISIRRRALDVMFTMCAESNVELLVEELLKYLTIADFSMREEIVLKTAVVAERFFPSLEWYVDSMLMLIERAGEFASKDVWYSTVQLVTNHDELHAYAAEKVVEALRRGASADALLGVSAYILGEYGSLLQDTSLRMQFNLLQARFPAAPTEIQASLLSAYMKMKVAAEGRDEALAKDIQAVFVTYQSFMDAELQQRAVEYWGLGQRPEVAKQNVLPMPHWEKRKSLLLRRLAERDGEDTEEQRDRPAWMQGAEEGAQGERPAALAISAPPEPGPPSPGANGAAEEPEPEPEAELQPAPPPPPTVEDLLMSLDDDGPGYNSNGHARALDPTDALLSDMGSSPPVPAALSGPYDPFSLDRSGYGSEQYSTAPVTPSTGRSGAGSATGNPFLDGAPSSASAATSAPPPGAAPAATAPVRGAVAPAAVGAAAAAAQAPAFALPAAGLPAPVVVGDLAAFHRKLLLADSGVLYEDTYLQVGLKSSYVGPHGQLVLFLGNKSAVALQRVVCALPPVQQLAFQLGAVPPLIEVKKQVQILLSVTALAPFVAVVRLQLGYQAGPHTQAQSLVLPLVATKFCSPPQALLPRDLFFSQWRTLAGPPQKVGERVVRQTPLRAKEPVSQLLAVLRLGELPGLDPVPANFVAAATLACAPPMGPPQQIPVLVRIEVDTSSFLQFQVTVATPDATATAAIKDLLCSQLAAIVA